MRDLAVLFLHLLATVARLAGPGGARAVVAESVLVKQQLLIRVHGKLQILEHFLGFREVVIRSAGGDEFAEMAVIIERACRFRAVWWTQRPATSSN
jgi:hypothetical protein